MIHKRSFFLQYLVTDQLSKLLQRVYKILIVLVCQITSKFWIIHEAEKNILPMVSVTSAPLISMVMGAVPSRVTVTRAPF